MTSEVTPNGSEQLWRCFTVWVFWLSYLLASTPAIPHFAIMIIVKISPLIVFALQTFFSYFSSVFIIFFFFFYS